VDGPTCIPRSAVGRVCSSPRWPESEAVTRSVARAHVFACVVGRPRAGRATAAEIRLSSTGPRDPFVKVESRSIQRRRVANTTVDRRSAGCCGLRERGIPGRGDVSSRRPLGPKAGTSFLRLSGHRRRATRKPVLLLAHLDVVEAVRADWTYDPFSSPRPAGYFYGRGNAGREGRGGDAHHDVASIEGRRALENRESRILIVRAHRR